MDIQTKTIASITILFSIFVFGPAQADQWSEAEKKIVRLDPAKFQELPGKFTEELKARKCTIPQTYGDTKAHNVISGSFAVEGQKDWAVLCSRDGVSEIMIFWGGTSGCPSALAKSPDKDWLQGIGNNKIGFSRAIGSVSKTYILEYQSEFGGPTPPADIHEGIEDSFVEKGSTIHYCSNGKWIELTGMTKEFKGLAPFNFYNPGCSSKQRGQVLPFDQCMSLVKHKI